MKKIFSVKNLTRFGFYILGMLSLALGLTLNTKSLLGASPIISMAYTLTQVWPQLVFGDLTLILYIIFVIAQYIIRGNKKNWIVFLQIPLSIVFTRFLNIFGKLFVMPTGTFVGKLLTLLAAIVFTGIGAAVTVNMKMVPNPGDGIVSAIADKIGKSMGTTKNIVDFTCVIISAILGLVLNHNIFTGIGLGTVIAMVGVGRVIALFNHLFKEKMNKISF